MTGKLYDIQGFSLHDGPGIRLTLFLKGCPLRCPWCHSPESQTFHAELNWIEKKCIGIEKCGRCISVCPFEAVLPGKAKEALDGSAEIHLVTVDREKCDNCGACAKACAAQALYMCGTDYTVDEMMERVLREAPFFKHSGGGVTISGGECLCQPEFTLQLLKNCKKEGIHTAIDTAGFVRWEQIESIMPYTDIFLYDIKGMDSTLHDRIIGVPNGIILENARKIAANGGKFQIRIPIIPKYSDSREVINDIGEFCLELCDAVDTVQILPYHKLGIAKWERLQNNKPVFMATPPTEALIQERKNQLESMGFNVIVH